MAIDTNQPVRSVQQQRDGSVILIRHGQDDGQDFTAGDFVVEEDGVLRLGTAREAQNYTLSNATDVRASNLKSKAQSAGSQQGGLPDIKDYLKAKFPEDFA